MIPAITPDRSQLGDAFDRLRTLVYIVPEKEMRIAIVLLEKSNLKLSSWNSSLQFEVTRRL